MIQFRKLKLPGSNQCPEFISGGTGQVSPRSHPELSTAVQFPFQLSQGALLLSLGHPGLGGVSEDKTGSDPGQLAAAVCEHWQGPAWAFLGFS